MNTNKSSVMPPTLIYAYTREQALADGVLCDVSEMAREVGISLPTAVTTAVWDRYVRVPKTCAGQDETGRLWDILWMLRCAMAATQTGCQLEFSVFVLNTPQRPQCVRMKAVCGPGDDGNAVITIMLPDED
jgi:hypothetical protein